MFDAVPIVQLNLQKAETTLTAALSLLGKLSGEKENWSSQSVALKADLLQLPKFAALSAAFITYLAAEPENVRSQMVIEWSKALEVTSYDFRCCYIPIPYIFKQTRIFSDKHVLQH